MPEPSTQNKELVYPGATWDRADAGSLGWRLEKLDEARRFSESLLPTAVMIVQGGQVIYAWGNVDKRIKSSSARKSFLSALYGIYVHDGRINLDKTLADIGIDDVPPLSATERQATVRMLLQSRSGIYYPYVGGSPEMRVNMPARGSHAPGTFWYYNNWDFNALGAIFERLTGTKIGQAFYERIAKPTQMQDFRPEDVYYVAPAEGESIFPAYPFHITARDMARFGYLFLREGQWQGRQVIPANWVKESTTSYSDTGRSGSGYGYLWWVAVNGNLFPDVKMPEGSYTAIGHLGKYVVVIPALDLVVAHAVEIDYPDRANDLSQEELARIPSFGDREIGKLLKMILDAKSQG
jgi:CubicO group peptidase (beta-lactamase class C family)